VNPPRRSTWCDQLAGAPHAAELEAAALGIPCFMCSVSATLLECALDVRRGGPRSSTRMGPGLPGGPAALAGAHLQPRLRKPAHAPRGPTRTQPFEDVPARPWGCAFRTPPPRKAVRTWRTGHPSRMGHSTTWRCTPWCGWANTIGNIGTPPNFFVRNPLNRPNALKNVYNVAGADALAHSFEPAKWPAGSRIHSLRKREVGSPAGLAAP